MSKRISFLVHGTVQGVNFRSHTKKAATSHGLTGWVRNTSNGKVQGEAQGPPEGIAALVKELNKGPRFAHVVKLEKKEIDVVEEKEGEDEAEGFRVLEDA